jgi:hypothetical protein
MTENLTVVVSGHLKVVRHAETAGAILEMFGPGEASHALRNTIRFDR